MRQATGERARIDYGLREPGLAGYIPQGWFIGGFNATSKSFQDAIFDIGYREQSHSI